MLFFVFVFCVGLKKYIGGPWNSFDTQRVTGGVMVDWTGYNGYNPHNIFGG